MGNVSERGDQAGTPADLRGHFWDRVYIGAWIAVGAMSLAIVVILAVIVYGFLTRAAPVVARLWAIGATLIVPISLVVGVAIGVSLAERRIQWHDRDTDRALQWIAGGLMSAGVKAGDARIYTLRGLRDTRPGPAPAPAFDFDALPPGDDRGVSQLGAGEVIEL